MPIVFEKSVFTNIANAIKNGVGTGLNLDAWGRQKVVEEVSLLHGMFTFEIPSAVWKETINGVENTNGFTHASSVNGKLNLEAGDTLNDETVLDTFRHPRYEPDRGHVYKSSIILPSPNAQGVRDFGMFTKESGYFFRLKSGELYACRQTTIDGGVTITTEDLISLPFDVDFEKGFTYDIQAKWRGVGGIGFWIGHPDTEVSTLVHYMKFLGTSTELSVFNPAMPIAFRCLNLGDNVVIQSGCVDVSTEGGGSYDGTYGSISTSSESGSIPVSGFNTPVLVVHSKDIFAGRINTRDILNLAVTASSDQKSVLRVWVTRDPTAITLNDQTWTDYRDKNIEFLEYNLPIVGTPMTFDTAKADLQFSTRVPQDQAVVSDAVFSKAAALVITPGDYLIFTVHRENGGTSSSGVTYEFSEEI